LKFTLINTPWLFEKRLEFLSQNLGLGYLAAVLEQDGHKISIIDALALGKDIKSKYPMKYQTPVRIGLSDEQILERIPADTDFIGISAAFTNNRPLVYDMVKLIKKKHPQLPIILGGVYPSALPDDAVNTGAHFVITGEGEIPICKIAAGKKPEHIDGLAMRNVNGELRINPAARVKNIDDIPYPARHLLPMDLYLKLSPRGVFDKKTASIITSRGCPYDCAFCSIHPVNGYAWRPRSVENTLGEIRQLVEKHSVEHIEIEDDNFTLNTQRAVGILDGLRSLSNELGKKITWECPNGTRIDSLNEDLLKKIKDSGCTRLYLALEHGDDDMLKIMRKNLHKEKVISVVELCKKLEIPLMIFFIVGFPGETKERFLNGIKFAKLLRDKGAERLVSFVAKPYPGTNLYEICKQNNWLKYPDSEEVFFGENTLAIRTPDFDESEVRQRMIYATRKLNPSIYKFKNELKSIFPVKWLRTIRKLLKL